MFCIRHHGTLLGILFVILFAGTASASTQFSLDEHWSLQDATSVNGDGKTISSPEFNPTGWHTANLPTTVIGALLSDGTIHEDPFLGKNFQNLPGPFPKGWWFRKQFRIPEKFEKREIDLHFDGINYSAEIWLNGKKLARTVDVVGTYRTYTFHLTSELKQDGLNTLAVIVYPPNPTDLSHSWVDWNPTPPDRNMGIWRDVYLTAHGTIALSNPQVITHLDPSSDSANVTVEVEARNGTPQSVTANVSVKLDETEIQSAVTLGPNETRMLTFSPSDFPALKIIHPKLWWPAQMGDPTLIPLEIRAEANGTTSDQISQKVGLREITSELTANRSKLFKVNGKPIFIRGGGWSSDIFLRFSRAKLRQEMEYVRDLNLNTIRLEGRFEPSYFLDMADRYGILVMPGWVCCNSWQNADHWPAANYKIAEASLRDQIKEFRAHPSTLVFLYGSDEHPPESVERMYLNVFRELHWPNPTLSSACEEVSDISGPTGVKMTGPYDYVPPSYWYVEKQKYGGAWGFNTETSVGPAIPDVESLKRFIPADHLWPVDDVWNFHAGLNQFASINVYHQGQDARYGASHSLEEFTLKARAMVYDGHRAMYEAYARNKYSTSTGVVQWMLNNAWPSLIWHLYDYYLIPGASYYAVKKANEPVHIQYSYDDHTVALVNSTYRELKGLHATARLFDFSMNEVSTQEWRGDLGSDSSASVITIPEFHGTPTYFLKLTLADDSNERVSDNFYWLSTKAEVFDWKKTDFTHTPVSSDGDLTLLNSLPKVKAEITSRFDLVNRVGTVTVKNPSQSLAFQMRLRLLNDAGKEIVGSLWSDNYFSLLPGEEKTLEVRFTETSLKQNPIVTIDGLNLTP